MKKYRKILLILLVCLFFCGCGKKQTRPVRVVTQVDVTYESGRQAFHRRYTKPQKIGQVLTYLRLQESLGRAKVDPERLIGSALSIRICLSDGSVCCYYQQGDCYLSKKYHPWQIVDPKKGAEFCQQLKKMPTDL